MKVKFLIAAGVMLVLAAFVQVIHYKPATGVARAVHLHQQLPENLSGWSGKDMPLGATEVQTGEVEKTLNFDEVYYREFNSGGRSLSLYVAYWKPGKMPTQLVASHTPDRCWTSAGWQCDAIRHEVALPGLRPGEWREFTSQGVDLKVMYWQLVGTELYDFGDRFNRMPSVWRWWRDVAKQIFRAPPEQYFIRITSNRPFAEIENDPGFQQVVAALGKLGLAEGRRGRAMTRQPLMMN